MDAWVFRNWFSTLVQKGGIMSAYDELCYETVKGACGHKAAAAWTRFTMAMSNKLAQNAHKNGWELDTIKALLERLQEELEELYVTINNQDHADTVENEAADVANFLLMIVDNYRRAKQQTAVLPVKFDNPLLPFFEYQHLKTPLREISMPFKSMARTILSKCPKNSETDIALRKLLEAKDCAVRAKLREQHNGER